MGRAKDIKESSSVPFLSGGFPKIQIGIAYKGHTPICGDCIRIDRMTDFCDAYIPCYLFVSAKGKILPPIHLESEYQTADETLPGICQYSGCQMPSIIESVRVYNRGALPCYVGYSIPLKIEPNEMHRVFDQLWKEKEIENRFYYDPLFATDKKEIEDLISTSQLEYVAAYANYLINRISKYADKQEFLHDFPYSNDYFYQKLQQTIEVMDTPNVAQWIAENKDYPWFRVEDKLVAMVKSMIKQKAIQTIRGNTNGLWSEDISKLTKYQLDQIPYLNE